MPQGLLDGATSVVLDVYAADAAACDGNTGRATAQGEGTKDSYPLESAGCATGASWCKTITLDRREADLKEEREWMVIWNRRRCSRYVEATRRGRAHWARAVLAGCVIQVSG